jgi:hypothetical protein
VVHRRWAGHMCPSAREPKEPRRARVDTFGSHNAPVKRRHRQDKDPKSGRVKRHHGAR